MSGLRNTDTERPEALLVGAWAKGQDTLLGQLEESFLRVTGKIILDQAQVGVWSDGLRGVVEMGLLLFYFPCI